nr:hypothetical protein [Tanacetum cinerariifolium]
YLSSPIINNIRLHTRRNSRYVKPKLLKLSLMNLLRLNLRTYLHLKYAFLEGGNKWPVIIAKELGDEEKSALIKQEASPAIVEPLRIELPFLEDQFQEDPPVDPPEVSMVDNRTMAELLQAPTEGYEDAIDSLNFAAGGNFLDKMPRECLKIIESKSKVRQSRAKVVIVKVSTSSSTLDISSDVAEFKDMVRALLLDKKNQSSAPTPSLTPAPVKAVEPNCVTCGGAHSYQNCPVTNRNVYRDNIQEYVSQAAAANYNQGNTSFRPQMVANQI